MSTYADDLRKKAIANARAALRDYHPKGGTLQMLIPTLRAVGFFDEYESEERRERRLAYDIVRTLGMRSVTQLLPGGKKIEHWFEHPSTMTAKQLEEIAETNKTQAGGNKNSCNDHRKSAKQLSGRKQKILEMWERASNS